MVAMVGFRYRSGVMGYPSLTITHLGAKRKDLAYHLNELKPAFNGSDSALSLIHI